MSKVLFVTGKCGSGKTTLAKQAAAYDGWRCRLYDGIFNDTDWSLPAHPLEVELIVVDHVGYAPAAEVQKVVAWCQENKVQLMLAEQTRADIEKVVGPLPADELKLVGLKEPPQFVEASTAQN